MTFDRKTTLAAIVTFCLSLAVFLQLDGVFGIVAAALIAVAIGVASFAMIEKFREGNNETAVVLAIFLAGAGAVVCFPALVAPDAVAIDRRMNASRKESRRILGGSEAYASLDARTIYSYHFGWRVYVQGELASHADLKKLTTDFERPLNELFVRYPVEAGLGLDNKRILLDTSKVMIQGKPCGSPSW